MASKSQADQAATGVFLIGLAVLFMTGFWWPGMLFVIGFSSMARRGRRTGLVQRAGRPVDDWPGADVLVRV